MKRLRSRSIPSMFASTLVFIFAGGTPHLANAGTQIIQDNRGSVQANFPSSLYVITSGQPAGPSRAAKPAYTLTTFPLPGGELGIGYTKSFYYTIAAKATPDKPLYWTGEFVQWKTTNDPDGPSSGVTEPVATVGASPPTGNGGKCKAAPGNPPPPAGSKSFGDTLRNSLYNDAGVAPVWQNYTDSFNRFNRIDAITPDSDDKGDCRYNNGAILKEQSPAWLTFESAIRPAEGQTELYIPFVVWAVSSGAPDWLEFAVDGVIFWKAPLTDFTVGQLYVATVPASLFNPLFTGSYVPKIWTYYLNSAGDTGSKVFFPMELAVELDVDPWSSANKIYPNNGDAGIPVAVMGKAVSAGDEFDFDATQIDPASVRFGAGEATNTLFLPWVADWNADSTQDLLLGFKTYDSAIACGDEKVVLTGETNDGIPFGGQTMVDTMDCETTSCHP